MNVTMSECLTETKRIAKKIINIKRINRALSLISVIALVVQTTIAGNIAGSFVFSAKPAFAVSAGSSVSKCEWWSQEEITPGNWGWASKINYDVTKAWCDGKSLPPNRLSTYTPAATAKISGYKYKDIINDGIDEGDTKIAGWEIVLSGSKSATTSTDANGYYVFSGLMPGNYTVSEGSNAEKGTFVQTVPAGSSYSIALSEAENKTGNDFANYFPSCGNSLTDVFDVYSEACDDGILNGVYGYCNSDCSGQTASICGNGAKEGDEQCDISDGVGAHQSCSDQCSIIDLPFCGDSVKNGDEACDGTDGVGEHQACTENCTIVDLAFCGDQTKNGNEQCDGGDGTSEHYSCTASCTLEYIPYCGDEIKNNNEACDTNDGIGDHQSCNNECSIVNIPYCGDEIKNNNEACDTNDGIGDHQSCSETCSIVELPYCGDGAKNQETEACDDGNTANGDGCSATCETEMPQGPVCGDNIKNGNEQCDGTQGIGEHESCNSQCVIQNDPYCGDNIVNGTEGCDGTAGVGEYQSCSNECTITNLPYCGDGEKNAADQCDDGNAANGDGCSATCEIEEENSNNNGESGNNNTGGGGSAAIMQFNISGESLRSSNIREDSVTITWLSSHFASSQVIYSLEGESHDLDLNDNSGTPPKYGYAHTTAEFDKDPKVTGHSATITGLTPGSVYYYRTVSRGSFAVSEEKSFTLPDAVVNNSDANTAETAVANNDEGEVKGITSTSEGDSRDCNYISSFIRIGGINDPGEVEKVEKFLNDFESENLSVDGKFEQADSDAISRFQKKYTSDILVPWNGNIPTGNVFTTTMSKINEIYCKKDLPLTAIQLDEISATKTRLALAIANSSSGDTESPAADKTAQDETASESVSNDASTNSENGNVKGASSENTENGSDGNISNETAKNNEIETKVAGYQTYLNYILIFAIIASAIYGYGYYRKGKREE